ncbi:hypothetical protein ES702_03582 [subsurface metagenome]
MKVSLCTWIIVGIERDWRKLMYRDDGLDI